MKINAPISAAAPERDLSNHRVTHYARPAALFHPHVSREAGGFSLPDFHSHLLPQRPDRGDGGRCQWELKDRVRSGRGSRAEGGRAHAQKWLRELEVEEWTNRWHNFTLMNGGSSLSHRGFTFFIVTVFYTMRIARWATTSQTATDRKYQAATEVLVSKVWKKKILFILSQFDWVDFVKKTLIPKALQGDWVQNHTAISALHRHHI